MKFLARVRLRGQTPASANSDAPNGNGLSPSAIQKGLRLSIIEGALSNIHLSTTTSILLTGFALLLGAKDFEIGLIGALPFIGQFFQFVGAYLEERLGNRRMLVILSAGVSRSLWAVIAMLPFIHSLGSARLTIFLIILAITQALLGICNNAWTSWMSDLVPPRQRGRYFGLRNNVASAVAMLSTMVTGWMVDRYTESGNPEVGYAIVFIAAVVAAIAGLVVISYQPEPPKPDLRATPLRDLFSAPLKHKRFRTLMICASLWALTINTVTSFYNAYALQYLEMSFTTLAFFTIIPSISGLIGQPLVGYCQDRFGDLKVMIISILGLVLLPWGWIGSSPGFYTPLLFCQIGAGLLWPGVTQGLINMVMDRAPAEGRGAYVATYGALTGASSFIASVLGGVFMSLLADFKITINGFTYTNYTTLFAISSLLRILMAYIFYRKL